MKRRLIALVVMFLFASMCFLSIAGNPSGENNILTDRGTIGSCNSNMEYWALLIGIGIYADHPEETVPSDLSAEAVYESLLSSENWQEDHIKIITRDEATKSNIKKGFQWLDSMEDEDDVSVIYIATHGGKLTFFGIPLDFPPFDERDHCDEFLITYYGFKYPFLTDLRDDEIKILLNRLDSQGICVIIDCCYSGGFNDISYKTLFKSNIFPLECNNRDFSSATFIKHFSEEIRKDGRVILMASQENEKAYGLYGIGHDFTTVLINSLGKGFGDFNDNGLISAEEAFNYSRSRLKSSKWRTQHPTICDNYYGELDITVSNYRTNFNDDCESDIGWTTIDHTGDIGGDLWHLSEIDCKSPTHCWYLGDEDTMRYNNNMNNSLVSPEIELGKKPLLTFTAQNSKEFPDSIWLDISEDNWYSYQTTIIKLYPWWNPKEISLYEPPFKDFSGKIIQMRFRVVTDESIPFDPRYCLGYFMIEDIQIYSEKGQG